jgi:TRAP transporter TAXI family solute receptor
MRHILLASIAAAFLTGIEGQANAQQVVIAGESNGGVITAASGGLAKVLTQNAGIKVRVRNFSSPEAWLPQLNSGRMHLGVHFSATAWLTYNQIDSKLKLKNLRLLRSSRATTPLGFMVRKDSAIKTVADLKGKRVAAGFGGHPIIRRLVEGSFAINDMTWKDVQQVPVVSAPNGAQAFLDGRVDAAWFALFAPQTREAHSKFGVRFLPMDVSPIQLKVLKEKVFPGVQQLRVPINLPFAAKGTPLLSYEFYVITSSNLHNETATKLLEALWKYDAEVRKVHPVLRGFTDKAAVTDNPVIPYHPAAVAFYKKKGIWSESVDKVNKALK